MILYHGSNMVVDQPKIIIPARTLDFGVGFYMTSDFEQARSWARRTYDREGTGIPTVSKYEFNEKDTDGLNVLIFTSPDRVWFRYVASNRDGTAENDNRDIVIGPVANDQTVWTIGSYLRGFLTEDIAIELLLPQRLKDQYVFKTERALSKLKYMGDERV